VDDELRRELLARRDEDQRIRKLVSPPPGQYTVRLPDEVGNGWTSAAHKPDLNRSLTTMPGCETGHSQR